ncbi:MAG: hypothetical protein JOS17DRAFT_753256 [Linnemannia elongata]|nr:MAG: hypothetical protein JOS17DRAFT_753256 [Linnemannia elongata]
MKVALITLVGLSTALTYVAAAVPAGTGPAQTGPAQAAPTPMTSEQVQAFAMKAAEPFLNLPGLRLQAAADEGIAKAEILLTEHFNTADDGADEGDEAAEGSPREKTGFSAEDVKQFRAAAASATANQVPLLTLKDGVECSDLCIANRGELPDTESETDSDDTEIEVNEAGAVPKVGDADDTDEEEEDDIEDDTDEGDVKARDEVEGLISRLWKRVVSPSAEAPAPASTDDNSDNADAAPDNAAAPAAATMDNNANMSEDELLSKVESCVQSCMLDRAREVTPEDLDDRRAQIDTILQKQEL